MDLWHIDEHTFDPKKLHSQETVYTIGNGYLGTRGTFEEGYPKASPATLLYGVFDKIDVGKEELANAPDWLPIQLYVNGERFRLDRGKILDYQRTLNMHNGLLQRTVSWQSPKGQRITVKAERFASLQDEHIVAIRYSVTADTQNTGNLDIQLVASINTAVGNYDLMHWRTVDQGHEGEISWLHSETLHSRVQLAQAMSFQTQAEGFKQEIVDSDIAPLIRQRGTLAPGATVTTEKIICMYTSRDLDRPLSTSIEHLRQIVTAGQGTQQGVFDRLLAENDQAWDAYWNDSDIVIEGDDKAQLAIRYNVYQLRISVDPHDDRYSVAAKGLTGFGYRGHIFHDTEIFMLPYYTYVHPAIARNLLLYRYHLLPGARAKAASNGYEGAQYPWESTLDGKEATPDAIIHPENGELIPVLNGPLELHISASIAHAPWEYWRVTGDNEFLRDYGAEVILSTAKFWVSRVTKSKDGSKYEINDVIGPDEWHEHVNNNAFTNFMVRWNIQKALEVLTWLKTNALQKATALTEQLDINDENLKLWQDVVQHLYVPQDQNGLFEQFEGFFKLEHLDQAKFKGRTTSYQGILGVETVQRYQIIKQADVLMLLTVLKDQFDTQTKRINWDYYFPITDHDYGSSLTPAFHAILASELGLTDIAYHMLMKGALVDLENLRGNTPEGIHNACTGAVWQAVIFGFAGLRLTDTGYTTHPEWPDGWKRLAFTFYHKGKRVHVDLHRNQAKTQP